MDALLDTAGGSMTTAALTSGAGRRGTVAWAIGYRAAMITSVRGSSPVEVTQSRPSGITAGEAGNGLLMPPLRWIYRVRALHYPSQ